MALTHSPDHMFSHLGLVNVYMKQNTRKGKEYLLAIYPEFETEGDFLLNAGKTLWDYAVQEDEAEEALSMIERGMCFISTKEAIDMYVSCIQNTWYIQRGIQFLHKLVDKEPDHIILLCSIGVLYEQQTRYTEAIAQYETALHIKEDFLPYYRLGETYEADQLLSVDADNLMGRYHRSRYLAALHRVEEAREELGRVLAEDESGYFESLAEHDPELQVLSIQHM